MEKEIINRVAKSGLITIEMKSFKGEQKRSHLDIKQWLHKGVILKEKIFRKHLTNYNWEQHKGKYVAVFCSVDTIIPVWAYMLVSKSLQPYADKIIYGNSEELEKIIFEHNIKAINTQKFIGKKVLIKGCSDIYVPIESYILITEILLKNVNSLMFGEACSNVHIYKS